jgi:hypothetical protein
VSGGKMTKETDQEVKTTHEVEKHDAFGSIIWALILIWAGGVFLVSNMGYLDRILTGASQITGLKSLDRVLTAWPLVLLGVGIILLLEVVLRLVIPNFRRSIVGTLILAIILIGISLGGLINWNLIWPSILIFLGLSIIYRGFKGRV